MSKDRPVIDHIEILIHGELVTRTFLPLFDEVLVWAEDVDGVLDGKGCPSSCAFACHVHPMVRDEIRENTLHKLCTLTGIRAGLVTRDEIMSEGR